MSNPIKIPQTGSEKPAALKCLPVRGSYAIGKAAGKLIMDCLVTMTLDKLFVKHFKLPYLL